MTLGRTETEGVFGGLRIGMHVHTYISLWNAEGSRLGPNESAAEETEDVRREPRQSMFVKCEGF